MSAPFGNSAYTLQKKSPTFWTFSKDSRFKSHRRSQDVEYRIPPSTLSMRSTSLGFGTRVEITNHTGKDSPPPGSYNLPTCFDNIIGPKIMKETVFPLINNRQLTPGPGAYNPKPGGSSSPKYSFRVKLKEKKKFQVPAPGSYDPRFTLTEFSAFKGVGFGIDARNFGLNKISGPGPGHYNIS